MAVSNHFFRLLWFGTNAERLAHSIPLNFSVWITTDTHAIYACMGGVWVSVGGGGGGGGHVIADEGGALPAEPTLNFTGNSVVASDNPGATRTDVTIALLDHDHSGAGDGGQLDWDDIWSDAVHDHSAAGEGGQLDWDDIWSDAVHDHSAAGEGGLLDASDETYTPAVVADWDGGVDPGNANDAFDQLAERTKDLEGSLTMVRETIFTYGGNCVLGGGLLRIYNKLGVAETISSVFISVNTAPTGSTLIVDVLKNGVTIFTNPAHRPEIAIGAFTATDGGVDVPNWADGDYLTAIVSQIGSTITGADLTVHVLHS